MCRSVVWVGEKKASFSHLAKDVGCEKSKHHGEKRGLRLMHQDRNAPQRKVAGGPGFEPELLGPEPRVLPLNYPPIAF